MSRSPDEAGCARRLSRGAIVTLGFTAALTGLSGCRRPAPSFAPPPPPEVTVESPRQQRIAITMEFTGVTRGVEEVDIRARVRGFLEKKHAQDGRRVKQGDLLFTIDPRTFDAAVRQAAAQVSARQADLKLAEVTLERTRLAAESNAVAKQEVDRAIAQRDAASAQVDLAKAQLRAAELDLEFTQIRSPIDGRIGFIKVDEGDLVGAADPTLLATVINDSKIYATYDMDERVILEQRRINQNRRPGEDGRPNLVVRLAQANDVGFPHEGMFDRADNAVNPNTGTVRVESIFNNPAGTLLPGAFVRVQPQFGEKDALTVPDVSVQSDQRGRFVLVVAADGKVERRDVQAGEVFNRQREILAGLAPSDRVIVNGLQRARPGMQVKAIESPAGGAASVPGPGANPTGEPAKTPDPGKRADPAHSVDDGKR